MITKEELNVIKEDIKILCKKNSELTEEELELVYGGASNGNNKYIWPVPGFYTVLSPFNDDRGRGSHNKGIFIADSGIEGALVVAADEGTVNPIMFSVGVLGSYGIYCQIDHENGRATRYAHLRELVVSPDQHVVKGQPIGYVGATGDTERPGLQFETSSFGVNYNPMSEY